MSDGEAKYRGLWKKQTQQGGPKYVGTAVVDGKEYWLNVYPNAYKRLDKHPEFTFNLVPKGQNDADKT